MALSGGSCRTSASPGGPAPPAPEVLELNVGGQVYYTRRATLAESASPMLGRLFSSSSTSNDLARDPRGRYFIDRDGFLFRYVLDFLRDRQVVLPDHFPERRRLRKEAEFFQLPELAALLGPAPGEEEEYEEEGELEGGGSQGSEGGPRPADRRSGFLTVAHRGWCACGAEGRGGAEGGCEARFRRVPRLLVCGRVALAQEVFGEALDQSRDPERSPERYTARFRLRFRHLERAFDLLAERGFRLVACSSGAAAGPAQDRGAWCSYTEYVFYRE